MTRVAPIFPLIVGRNGAFAHVRSSSAQGSCGTKGYPCKHPGTDVVGRAGTRVVAPESGTVVAAADGSSSPFGGYGPWLIVIKGDSGKYHLLAHLDPSTANMAPLGARVSAGGIVGSVSAANHVHWEVRDKMVPNFSAGEDNFTNNVDPTTWLSSTSIVIPALIAIGAGALFWAWRNR